MSTAMIRITLYSRRDCHLCHDMRAIVDEVALIVPLEIEELDIDENPELTVAYDTEVPVLAVNGRKAFKYAVDAAALRARLAREPRGA